MSSAQEEFDELMRDKSHRHTHPEDTHAHDHDTADLSDQDSHDPTQNNHTRRPIASSRARASPSAPPAASGPRPSLSIPRTRYAANTGPKGVISDAQDFREERRRALQEQKQQDQLRNGLGGLALGAGHVNGHAGGKKFGETEVEQKMRTGGREEDEDEDEDEDDDFDDDLDDEFMQAWRRDRLRDMQRGSIREAPAVLSSRGRYGNLSLVDPDGYLDAVDNSPAETVVVVYIYDDYSHVSSAIETCIRTLAGKHPQTRFVKLHFEDAEMEIAGVPALIAYRGGQKFAALVPIIDEIPDDAELSAITLERVLQRHQILR